MGVGHKRPKMSPHLLWVAVFVIASLSATLEAADLPSPDEKKGGDTTSPIIEKLDNLAARLKHLLLRNNSAGDIAKLKQYVFLTVTDIKSDIVTLFVNNSKQKGEGERLLRPVVLKQRISRYNIFKMCKHIIDNDVCQLMEEHQDQIDTKKLLRIADRLINVKTRFQIYSAIYDDMIANHYDNIFNLNYFVTLLVRHFILNTNIPADVTQDAEILLVNIAKTFKTAASQQLVEHILNNCTTSHIDNALWQLTVNVQAFAEFFDVLETAINATYDFVGPLALLDRSIWSRSAFGACRTVYQIHSRIQTDRHLYDTDVTFKLVQLIALALNNPRTTLDELEPCLEVETQLNPSVREILYARRGCLQNQLYKALMFPIVRDHINDSEVYVSNGNENAHHALWDFEADGLNTFSIRHHKTKEYLYASQIPVRPVNARDNGYKMTTQNARKSRWNLELIPENVGVRILDEERRYLYATQQVLGGDYKKHLTAVWRGRGVPMGSVWMVVQC